MIQQITLEMQTSYGEVATVFAVIDTTARTVVFLPPTPPFFHSLDEHGEPHCLYRHAVLRPSEFRHTDDESAFNGPVEIDARLSYCHEGHLLNLGTVTAVSMA